MKVWQQAYLFLYSMSVECLPVSCLVTFCISPQIENADDVLIMPLERFRKEQISAAKVRIYYDWTPEKGAIEARNSGLSCILIFLLQFFFS